VTLRDLSVDAIRSDSQGAYVDGVKGSVCHIFTGASEDLTIGTFQSGRTIHFAYSPASDVAQPTANPPAGSLVDNAFVNIGNIGSMPVGSSKTTGASFNTAVGIFRWPLEYNLRVLVTRNSRTNWTVATDPAGVLPDVGDLSVLLVNAPRNTLAAVGFYHMPFGMDVNCPTCP
jgi:hypothetical protein